MKKEEVVMFASDEAAQLKTITGWVDRHGRYFGNDERLARYSGSTHDVCECGKVRSKGWTICESCREKKRREEYLALPYKEYDGSPVYSDSHDKYFFDQDDIETFLADELNETSIDLVFCTPVKYSHIDYDYWEDSLAEDQELNESLAKKVEELNSFIDTLAPSCYMPGKVRTTFTVQS